MQCHPCDSSVLCRARRACQPPFRLGNWFFKRLVGGEVSGPVCIPLHCARHLLLSLQVLGTLLGSFLGFRIGRVPTGKKQCCFPGIRGLLPHSQSSAWSEQALCLIHPPVSMAFRMGVVRLMAASSSLQVLCQRDHAWHHGVPEGQLMTPTPLAAGSCLSSESGGKKRNKPPRIEPV